MLDISVHTVWLPEESGACASVRREAGHREDDRAPTTGSAGALRTWKAAILAYFDTDRASNGPTEANNGVIETARRIARGFRNFTNSRLRCLLAAGGHRPYRIKRANNA